MTAGASYCVEYSAVLSTGSRNKPHAGLNRILSKSALLLAFLARLFSPNLLASGVRYRNPPRSSQALSERECGRSRGSESTDRNRLKDSEKSVNRLCKRLCELAGLDGFWTESGPTDLAQRAQLTPRSLSRSQRSLLNLAFFAWGRESHGVMTLAELMRLPPREMARATAFLRGLARKRGAR